MINRIFFKIFLSLFVFAVLSSQNSVESNNEILIYTLPYGDGDLEIGRRQSPYSPGPDGITIDENENLYILDGINARIIIIRKNGDFEEIYFKSIIPDTETDYSKTVVLGIEVLNSRYIFLITKIGFYIFDVKNYSTNKLDDEYTKMLFEMDIRFMVVNYHDYIIVKPRFDEYYVLFTKDGTIGSFDDIIDQNKNIGINIKKENGRYFVNDRWFFLNFADFIGKESSTQDYLIGYDKNDNEYWISGGNQSYSIYNKEKEIIYTHIIENGTIHKYRSCVSKNGTVYFTNAIGGRDFEIYKCLRQN